MMPTTKPSARSKPGRWLHATPRAVIALVLAGLLAATGIAGADPKADAKVHVDKATAHHAAGKFADALLELQAAYAVDPQPGLLYAMAQMQVKLDRCEDAIGNYEKFVATQPGEMPAKAATEAIAACKLAIAARPRPEPKPGPKPTPKPEPKPEPVITPAPDPMPRDTGRAWYADPLGGALVGSGVIGAVVGVVLYRSASADIDKAEAAVDYGTSEDLVDGARGKRRNATIAGAVGGALVIGGIVRYATAGGRETKSVAVVPTIGGAAVTWSGRW